MELKHPKEFAFPIFISRAMISGFSSGGGLMLSFSFQSLAKRHLRGLTIRILLIAVLVSAPTLSVFAQTWNLAWSDEFNGAANSAISAQNWTYDTGILNVNNEVEYYCAPDTATAPCNTSNPNAYIDGNGHLVIQALRINTGVAAYSGSWSSARLKSQTFQYGRVESSMSLPLGPGIWPAFWALGTNITSAGWPACGEMDFMEDVPLSSGLGPNTISSTMHGGNSSSSCYCGGNGLSKKFTFPAGDPNGTDVTTFHTYGAIWSPSMVQFYADDPTKVFFVRTVNDLPSGFTWDFNHPFFLLLNLAIGGTGSWPGAPDSTTPSPALMKVDYVRVYTASPVTAPSMTAPAISITAGQTGSSTVSLTSTAGAGRVYLACSTTAPKATCAIQSADSLNQYTVDFSSSATSTASVAVTTTANTSARMNWPLGFSGLGVGVLALAFAPSKRRRTSLMLAGGLLLWICCVPSCGGSGSSASAGGGNTPNGTPPGSYTVTVSAYTMSGNGNAADASVTIPLTVK